MSKRFLLFTMWETVRHFSLDSEGELHFCVNYPLESCPFKVIQNNTDRAWEYCLFLCCPKAALSEGTLRQLCWSRGQWVEIVALLTLPSSC